MKLFFTLWMAGVPGIAAVSWLVMPALVQGQPLPVPLWVVSVASAIQSMLLLAAASYCGVKLAPQTGLQTPFLASLASRAPDLQALRRQLLPGLAGGLFGALVLWAFSHFAPEPLARVQGQLAMPLVVRVLYGGITEEILVRWGLMTFLAWLFWRLVPRRGAAPSSAQVWMAIAVSALLFGVLHLPAAAGMLGALSPELVTYIVAGNTAFGLAAGFLYKQYGLESTIVAHILAHVLAFPVLP